MATAYWDSQGSWNDEHGHGDEVLVLSRLKPRHSHSQVNVFKSFQCALDSGRFVETTAFAFSSPCIQVDLRFGLRFVLGKEIEFSIAPLVVVVGVVVVSRFLLSRQLFASVWPRPAASAVWEQTDLEAFPVHAMVCGNRLISKPFRFTPWLSYRRVVVWINNQNQSLVVPLVGFIAFKSVIAGSQAREAGCPGIQWLGTQTASPGNDLIWATKAFSSGNNSRIDSERLGELGGWSIEKSCWLPLVSFRINITATCTIGNFFQQCLDAT